MATETTYFFDDMRIGPGLVVTGKAVLRIDTDSNNESTFEVESVALESEPRIHGQFEERTDIIREDAGGFDKVVFARISEQLQKDDDAHQAAYDAWCEEGEYIRSVVAA